jgi:predicted nucleic acid-binding protein
MIVLDTNIISEWFKSQPNPAIFAWLAENPKEKLMLTSITVAELYYGLNLLDEGKRRRDLKRGVDSLLADEFLGQILDFGQQAAKHYGTLANQLKTKGIVIGQSDTMIAAIVAEHQATLLTRNDKHFVHCGIKVVNPF